MIKIHRPNPEIRHKPKTRWYNDLSFYVKMIPPIMIMGVLITYFKLANPIYEKLHGVKGNGK